MALLVSCYECGTKADCVNTNEYGWLCAECLFRKVDLGGLTVGVEDPKCENCGEELAVTCYDCSSCDESHENWCSECGETGIDATCSSCQTNVCDNCGDDSVVHCIDCAMEIWELEEVIPVDKVITAADGTMTIDAQEVRWN